MSYYSLDAILMEQEPIPCTMMGAAKGLGALDPNSDSEDLQSNVKLHLPLWLAREWSTKQPGMLEVGVPRIFSEGHRELLKADSKVVNLPAWSHYFYAFGLQFLDVTEDDDAARDIADVLVKAFEARYPMIMDISHNAVQDDMSATSRILDLLEKNLFETGLQCDREFQQWCRGQAHKIRAVDHPTGSQVKRRKTES